ncbi:hypothetical protein HKX48_007908 [Thoreauomyces humboldtii]|nr:hypothetical protein HKX48_007908 [Thoreauomyces humboldtii]
MREYVDVDIPSAINMIKQIGGYSKVYLIGHSMGGALSCAVAGICPDDIAGVIHLAGLYHYTLPGLSEVIDLYKAFCPSPIKAVVRTSTNLAARSVAAVLSPVVSTVSYILGNSETKIRVAPSDLAPAAGVDNYEPGPGALMTTSNALMPSAVPLPPALNYPQQFLTHLKRQPIPVKTALNALLFIRQFVPGRIEKAFMNAIYPSPWVANSVEDPWGLMKASVESPSVGVYCSIAQMAIHHEFYNNWVVSNTAHRADVASDELEPPSGPVGADRPPAPPLGTARSGSSASSSSVTSASNTRVQETDPQSWNELTTYLHKFESLVHLPLFFCYANADGVIRMKDSLVGYERSGSFWKEVIHYEDEALDESAGTGGKAGSGEAGKSGTRQSEAKMREKIVEGVKESFEDAVKVLMTGEDNLGMRSPAIQSETAGPLGGGGILDNPTHLSVPQPQTQRPSSPSKRSSVTSDQQDELKVRWSPLVDDQTAASTILWAGRPPAKSMSSNSLHTMPSSQIPRDRDRRPSLSTTAAPPAASSAGHASSSGGPSGPSGSAATGGSSSGLSSGSKPTFPASISMDPGTSYGHVDILGGVHAELMWIRIVEWLDRTSGRERQWRFWRRYSAK